MNRTRNQEASHARFAASGGSCAPVIPGVGLLTYSMSKELNPNSESKMGSDVPLHFNDG